jgi:competence ComEA-like helix-hairpin-helix protein
MTVLQSLAIQILMLGMTVGIIYWGVSADDQRQTPASSPSILSGAVEPSEAVKAFPEVTSAGRDPFPESDRKVPTALEPLPSDDPAPPVDSKVAVLTPSETGPPLSVRRAKSSITAPARRPVRFPIDLNKASKHDIVELPGIGDKLADRIVQYRKNHGPFKRIDDLRKVKGIGKMRMERLRPLVTTAGAHD